MFPEGCESDFAMEDTLPNGVIPVDTISLEANPIKVDSEKDAVVKAGRDCEMDVDVDSFSDSILCDPNSRLITTGLTRCGCTDEWLMFINAGGDNSNEVDPGLNILRDAHFEGGNVLRTDESICEAGDYPFIYQSARVGNFSYGISNLPPGEYFIDFHFAEIINTRGPKGIRVFDVFLQEEKVLSEFDIYSVVGANRPLQLVDLRVTVMEDGMIRMRFEGINGSPMVSGICVRKTQEPSVSKVSNEYIKCNNCAANIEISPAQKKVLRAKALDKYEKKIQELTKQCQLKMDECHEAWMSLTASNEQLEKVRMELDIKTFELRSLDQTVGKQAESLSSISSKYESCQRQWGAAIIDLHMKIKEMKKEQSQLSQEAHECVESIPELNEMVGGVQALVSQCEDLKLKYSEEQAKRKVLHNQIQETKGNIRVFCRCRPLNKEETSSGCSTVVDFDSAKDGDLGILTGGSSKKNYKFDRVFSPRENQVDVFADASPLVVSVLDGYNVCIFAYGQTGTGKTFTMEGTTQNRGVNYRTLEQLFEISKERRETFEYSISVSVLEVYNEQIRDLLATSPGSKKLEIKQSSEGSHHVPGLVEAKVENIKEVWNVLQTGSSARAIGSNNVNEHSSRSHCMLCIMVKAKNLLNGESTKSKLWLVDLAGSERLAKTDAQGDRLKEAQNINRSLSALGDVISALANKSTHIPYRNSKLTHLLQDSLGGDSKTLMFVQISPSDQDLSETLSSLNFATRVRGVELGPAKKQIDTGELQKMKSMLEKARQECRYKDESLKKLEENLQNIESKTKGRDQIYRTLQEKNKELEGQLESKTNLLKGREETCSSLQQKVKELECKLHERHQSETANQKQKVRDLEDKLKEFESHFLNLQQKKTELERELKETQEQNSESVLLHQKIKELEMKQIAEENQESLLLQKIKELEDKIREQDDKIQSMESRDIPETTKAIANDVKTSIVDENFTNDSFESRVLKSSNSSNRPSSRQSRPSLSKRNDFSCLHETTRRKRDSRSGEIENNADGKEKRIRKSDPPKIVGRLTRPTKPAGTTSTSSNQAPLAQKRVISRDRQVQGGKEKDVKRNVWSR